jgi:hypothetical protein
MFKGSVQQKLSWIENGVNQCVWAWDCGAGRFFVVLLRLHLALTICPFPVSIAQLIVYEGRSASPIKALYELLLALRCSLR